MSESSDFVGNSMQSRLEASTGPMPDGPGADSLRRQLLQDRAARDAYPTVLLSCEPGRKPHFDVEIPPELLHSFTGSRTGVKAIHPPEVGEDLFGFRLCHELGRGAFARVFLAQQTDLAGRPVVLKVSGIEGTEPQTLAQLQHTHIVPIHSVHEDARTGLRALCMPYFGGASLSDILGRLWRSPHPGSGRDLVAALDAVSAPAAETLRGRPGGDNPAADPRPGAPGQTPRSLLAGFTFIQTAAWIVARLAEGLAHAHHRGVLHRDIKPSNVLIGSDGEPMLLDFNLAHCESDSPEQAGLGGTIAYMAPEHLRALGKRDFSPANQVDERSDIYSLGMVLYEMLASRSPFARSGSYSSLPLMVEAMAQERGGVTPSLRQRRPDVPWSLESIVRRCLAPEAADRYQRAEELAADLNCFLGDQPLRHAPELSLVERGQKWLRRHPRITSAASVSAAATVLLLLAAVALLGVRQRLTNTRNQLALSHAQDRQRAYEAGSLRALFLVNTTDEYRDHVRQGLRVCEETLQLYEVLDRPDWQEHPDWQRLPAADRARLSEDTRELLLLLAGARVRLAPGDRATLGEALALLERAEAIPGLAPCRALWEDRAAYQKRLGDRVQAEAALDEARAIEAATARDHYLLAMTHGRQGRFAEAVKHLNEALRLNPRHYWSWMQRGLCHQAQGSHALATGDFGACVGLWPDFAWGYFNRACAMAESGFKAEAVEDYTRALERDGELTSAFFNRGMLHLELRQYQPALGDFRRAQQQGRDDSALHSSLGVALEGLRRHREADAAFAAWETRAANEPRDLRNRQRRVYGFAVASRLPERAKEAFEDVLRDNPADAQALYGCAMLLDGQGKGEEALAFYNLALQAAPGLEEARRFRAVLLARDGRFQQARLDINLCLSQPHVPPGTVYAAACVAALQAARSKTPDEVRANTQEALKLLGEAFARGYGVATAATDRDLDGVRQLPAFRRLRETYTRAAK